MAQVTKIEDVQPKGRAPPLLTTPARSVDSILSNRLATCVALAVSVFASRIWLIAEWGSPVPFWDQWGVEGSLYRAWLSGALQWRDLIAAHNEHRIALTRLADLVLFVVCGGWNPWAQLLLNAALHATTAAVVAAAFWRVFPPGPRAVLVVGVAVLFTSTAGWQNALWGFQSQVYFTNLFAVIAIVVLATTHPLHARWWLAPTGMMLAVFSNAGGLLASVVCLGVAWPQARSRRAWVAWAIIVAVVIVGAVLRVSSPHHAPLQARTVEQFLAVFGRGLSWPHVNSAWAWLAMQLPLVWLLAESIRTGGKPRTNRGQSIRVEPTSGRSHLPACSVADRCAFALAALAILHAAAVAYSRGAGLPEFRPLSRYQDPLILGAAAQLYAAVRLATTHDRHGRMLLLGWSGFFIAGLISLTATHFSLNLPYKLAQDVAAIAQIHTYHRTLNPNAFADGATFAAPDSNPAEVMRVLDDPILQPILPKDFRDDVPRPWLLVHARVLTYCAVLLFVSVLALSVRTKSH